MSSKKYLNKTFNFTFFLNSLCLGKCVSYFASCVWEMSEIRNRFIQKHKYKTLQAHLQRTHSLLLPTAPLQTTVTQCPW